jgi:hypothetical protein
VPRRPRLPVARLLVVALAAIGAGCVPDTGELVQVRGPAGETSIAAGITALDFIVAQQSYCGRWVGVASATHHRVDVSGRDLTKRPYEFLIEPTHQTNLDDLVYVGALAYAADGRLVGEATFGAHALSKDKILERSQRIGILSAAGQNGGPQYVAADGCVCAPGQPWIGNGSGSGCDVDVITTFDRLGDTAGCELPAGAALPMACDGQQYPNEVPDRILPCWADDDSGVCREGGRTCTDRDGYAYNSECVTTSDDPMLPSDTLCAQYLGCEQTACGDLVGCFGSSFTTSANVKCTLHVDPTTTPGAPIAPCAGGSWTAPLPGSSATDTTCLAAVLKSVSQPPLTVGLAQAMVMGAQVRATSCPATLQIDKIDVPYPMALPAMQTVDLVVGETLTHVTIAFVQECGATEPALVCSAQ